MRKIFILVLFCCFLLLTCVETYSPTVNNESSYTVIFTLTTGYWTQENLILQPGESYVHEPMPISLKHNIDSFDPMESVILTTFGDVYKFSDKSKPEPTPEPEPEPEPEPIQASIYNSLLKDVILSGNGSISTDPLTIIAGQEITTETIIKNNPSFNAMTTDGYPVVVNYSLTAEGYKIILR